MRFLISIKLVIAMLVASYVSSDVLPLVVVGAWKIQAPYDTPQPAGLTAKQEMYIRSLHLHYTSESLKVCGKSIPIRPIRIKNLTSDEFLQSYGFLPKVIGLGATPVIDVSIHATNMMDACGDYESPGVHLLVGQNNHVVMEVANEYFPLKRLSPHHK